MVLAWIKNPQPKGIVYFQSHLSNPETVTNLFSFCQIAAGYINADGWQFLFDTFGVEGLLELKIKSGWLNSIQKDVPVSDLVYQSFLSGYNPLNQEKGDYDETVEVFLSLDGFKREIDWREIDKMN